MKPLAVIDRQVTAGARRQEEGLRVPRSASRSAPTGGVSRPRQRRALAEVVPAQVLDARLQGAVQRGLGSGLGVGEQEEGDGCQDELPPEAGATRDICLS